MSTEFRSNRIEFKDNVTLAPLVPEEDPINMAGFAFDIVGTAKTIELRLPVGDATGDSPEQVDGIPNKFVQAGALVKALEKLFADHPELRIQDPQNTEDHSRPSETNAGVIMVVIESKRKATPSHDYVETMNVLRTLGIKEKQWAPQSNTGTSADGILKKYQRTKREII